MRKIRLLTLLAVWLVGTVAGCSPKKKEILIVPVTGVAKVEGQALPVGWIVFHPDHERGNTSTHLPFAEVSSDGAFELSTNGKPGAAPGHYKVVVVATLDTLPAAPSFDPAKQPRWLMAEKYLKPETTDLLIEVIDKAEPGRYDLKLSR